MQLPAQDAWPTAPGGSDALAMVISCDDGDLLYSEGK